jgi:hypothetical protein
VNTPALKAAAAAGGEQMETTVLSRTNKSFSDDAAGAQGGACWVVDGATGYYGSLIPGERSDAQWYARTMSALLAASAEDTSRPLKAIVKSAVRKISGLYSEKTAGRDVPPQAYPSATIAAARLNGDMLETYLLGDCVIAVSLSDRTEVIRDERGKVLEDSLIERMHAYQNQTGCGIMKAREHFARDFKANRARMNTAGGYYILSFDEQAAEMGFATDFPAGGAADFMIMTDGFYRAVDVFDIYPDGSSLLSAARSDGPEAIWEQISLKEMSDPECTLYPRTKQFDDSSAVFCALR